MTEPMKGLAEYLRAQAMQRDAMLGKPYPQAIDELRRWAAEVEASRLPLAGAAPSDPTLKQPEVVNPMAEWPWVTSNEWNGHINAVFNAVREAPYGAYVPVAVLYEMRRILLASNALVRLRHDVRTAWMTGVPNYREFYDHALYAVLGITCLQDLYDKPTTTGETK